MSFQKKGTYKYLTKNTPHEELLAECKRLKNYICQLKFKLHEDVDKRRKIRKDWKVRVEKMRYKLLKKDQFLWVKDRHIENLRKRNKQIAGKQRAVGYKRAMKRVLVNHYKVKHLAVFLMKANDVMNIYGLDFREYAFVMWAGRFEFFNRQDFDLTVGDIDISFYSTVNRLIKKGYISFVEKKSSNARRLFSLTGTGVDMYNKVAKFTNKYFREVK